MDKEKLLLLIAAIATLKPEEFTKGGSPQTAALSFAVGFDVTAVERDEAWAEVQKQKAADLPSDDDIKKDLPKESTVPAVAKETKTPAFDKEGATSMITHRDGLKRIWYRDGKEIGVENVG